MNKSRSSLSVVVGLLSFPFLWVLQKEEVHTSTREEHAGAETANAESDEQSATPEVHLRPDEERPTPRHAQNKGQNNIKRTKGRWFNDRSLMTFFNGVIAIFTVIYASASIYQYYLSRYQITLVEQQIAVSTKQWQEVYRTTLIDIESAELSGLVVGQQPSFSIIFKNGGTQPAYRFSAQGRFHKGKEPVPNFNWASDPVMVTGSFLPAGAMSGKFTFTDSTPLTAADISSIEQGDVRLYFYGEARWKQRFGSEDTPFWFCSYYDPRSHYMVYCN